MPKRTGRPRGLTPDGAEIKRIRVEELRLSTAELAARIGRDPQTVRHAERGGRISDVIASRLAFELGVDVSRILAKQEAA
jgi:DNA-binding transcriptional regulator YiaG